MDQEAQTTIEAELAALRTLETEWPEVRTTWQKWLREGMSAADAIAELQTW